MKNKKIHLDKLKEISQNIDNPKYNKENALEVLKHLINTSNNEKIRIDAIKLLIGLKLKNHIIFKILEKCLLSDESYSVRGLCAKYLLLMYPNKCRDSIKWTLRHDTSPIVLKIIKDLSFGMDGHKLEMLR
ncbi:MAG: HEAT repeat domain-containing protein [Promethearchaeota archaeon]|nr:MAG: HEAT repeat domain-containing protein [Candidatus Lokiarchaeota archaeon]